MATKANSMTVKDLIAALQKHDPNLPVFIDMHGDIYGIHLELDGYVVRYPGGKSKDYDCLNLVPKELTFK